MNGDNHFFGRFFSKYGPAPERAFISNYQELGYLKNGILIVLLPKQRVESYQTKDTHIISNKLQYMEISEAWYLELILTHDEAYVARVRASLQDVRAGRIQRGTANDLIKELSLED